MSDLQTISAKIPLEIVQQLKAAAKTEGISTSAWVAQAICEKLGLPSKPVNPLIEVVNHLQERVARLEKEVFTPTDIPLVNRGKPTVDRHGKLSKEQITEARKSLSSKLVEGKSSVSASTMRREAKKFGTTADKLAESVGWLKMGSGNTATYRPSH